MKWHFLCSVSNPLNPKGSQIKTCIKEEKGTWGIEREKERERERDQANRESNLSLAINTQAIPLHCTKQQQGKSNKEHKNLPEKYSAIVLDGSW